MNPYDLERLDGWISDFSDTATFATLPPAGKEHAETIVRETMIRACERRDVGPADVEEGDLRAALIDRVSALGLPPSAHDAVPAHQPCSTPT